MDNSRFGNLSFSYYCEANYTGCYVEYINNCFNETIDNQINIYSPIYTCIIDVTQTYSYKFECDISGMIYKEYTSLTCDEKKLILTKNIFDCTLISNDESHYSQDRYFEVFIYLLFIYFFHISNCLQSLSILLSVLCVLLFFFFLLLFLFVLFFTLRFIIKTPKNNQINSLQVVIYLQQENQL